MGRPKITIETGTVFGHLTAVREDGGKVGRYAVLCLCDCGRSSVVTGSNLRKGLVSSCGCRGTLGKYMNLVGKKFGMLSVLDDSLHQKKHRAVRCQCDCGKKTIQLLHAVVDGRVISCGCYRREALKARSSKHGSAPRGAVTQEYKIWSGMRRRCNDEKCKAYPSYGGRGIKLCSRWDDFSAFLSDMGNRPSPYHSIDRIDNNKGYEPGNCRWATRLQQTNNRRVTQIVEFRGRTQSIADWAREIGVQYWSLRNRIINLGWPVEKAILESFKLGRNQFS